MNRLLLASPVLFLTSFGCQIEISGSGASISGVRIQEQAERTDVRALELAPADVLTLLTTYGKVEVAASDGPAELTATVRANGRTVEEAQAVLARYELKLERGPDGPKAELVGEPLVVHAGSTHLELSAHVDFVAKVPAGTRLDARSGSGDLVTRGALGALELATEYGAIRIDEARGDVHARSGSGEISAQKLEGDELELASQYGAVRVQQARAKRLALKSGSGDLRVDEADAGALELATDYGAVHVKQAGGSVRARSGSGDVRVHGARGAVVAKSDYGAVEVDGVLTELTATSGSGDVRVRAQAESRVDPTWKIASDYGHVVLEVPDGFACALDAHTDYGSVECDFPVTIEAGKRKTEHALRGTIAGGGGTVTLSSGSGDVALKKR